MPAIYHIKHIDTLAGIIGEGGIWCDRECQSRCLTGTAIGYQHIKERRMQRRVPLGPAGSLGDYVPFYFAPRSPMLCAIHHGHNPAYTGGQSSIVHLVSSTEVVQSANPPLEFLFSDGHAEMEMSNFYDDLGVLETVVDWPVMRSRYWRDTQSDGDRKRRRQAEFLVRRFFPWLLISELCVHDGATAQRLQEVLRMSGHQPNIRIDRTWYY